jgi:hypothetical protein
MLEKEANVACVEALQGSAARNHGAGKSDEPNSTHALQSGIVIHR